MTEMALTILSKQIYLMGLIAAFIIGGVLREEGYFALLYRWLSSRLNSKKAVLAIMSMVGGVLPIEGRCSVSAPILDSMVDENSAGRKKMGLVDYISTHHYYLWSPIEPSVVIFMTALGISWLTFMQATILPLLLYLAFFFAIIAVYVKQEDIKFHEENINRITSNNQLGTSKFITIVPIVLILFAVGLMIYDPKAFAFWHTFPFVAFAIWLMSSVPFKKAIAFIKWPVILMVGIIIALGTIAKSFNGEIVQLVENSGFTIIGLLFLGGVGAFFMGSSSKYAGLGAAMISVTSPVFLPIVIVAEFVGYLLSPVHKCLAITKMYFNTPIFTFYKFLIPLSIGVLGAGGITYLLFK